jgi:hypothetical protein
MLRHSILVVQARHPARQGEGEPIKDFVGRQFFVRHREAGIGRGKVDCV